jgi:hypothetical protein
MLLGAPVVQWEQVLHSQRVSFLRPLATLSLLLFHFQRRNNCISVCLTVRTVNELWSQLAYTDNLCHSYIIELIYGHVSKSLGLCGVCVTTNRLYLFWTLSKWPRGLKLQLCFQRNVTYQECCFTIASSTNNKDMAYIWDMKLSQRWLWSVLSSGV